MGRRVALSEWETQSLQDRRQRRVQAGDPAEATAIAERQSQDADRSELRDQGRAGLALERPVREQLQEVEDQERDHGAEEQGSNAACLAFSPCSCACSCARCNSILSLKAFSR